MTIGEIRARIERTGIIPAVRVSSAEEALFAASAVCSGGIGVIEITTTTPGAIEVIQELARSRPELIVGAGTVLDMETALACLDAGAVFLTSPGLDLEIVNLGAAKSVMVIPGALTATEVSTARKVGVDFIKIFPCSLVGGAAYIRALKGPFPHIAFMASGGVNQKTAADFIRAGASVLGIGEDLIPHEAVQRRDVTWIHELTRRFLGMVHAGRSDHKN
jgi:2-dehydro-3-deoxyphosphogluconate aldolase/(4S)-4-hydroxy-2-oxoglutarate aldolase